VINKADREGAQQVKRDLRGMLNLTERPEGSWKPPVLATVATNGEGIDAVVEKLEEHRVWARESGALNRRRVRRARDEVEAIALTGMRRRWADLAQGERLHDLAEQVVAGALDPYSAADTLLGDAGQ